MAQMKFVMYKSITAQSHVKAIVAINPNVVNIVNKFDRTSALQHSGSFISYPQ